MTTRSRCVVYMAAHRAPTREPVQLLELPVALKCTKRMVLRRPMGSFITCARDIRGFVRLVRVVPLIDLAYCSILLTRITR